MMRTLIAHTLLLCSRTAPTAALRRAGLPLTLRTRMGFGAAGGKSQSEVE